METGTRSLVKTISWRLTGTCATFFISYLILGSFSIASTIALVQLITNTILYYLHERVWNRIKWGLNKYHVRFNTKHCK
jgi:uncharacterized membrane protein